MPERFESKVIIVTNSKSGFGKGIAEKFVRKGAKVVIINIIENIGKKAIKELGCEFIKTNITNCKNWEKIVKLVDKKYSAIYAIVNNASIIYKNKVS